MNYDKKQQTTNHNNIPSNLVELLCQRAIEQGEQQAYTFLVDGKKETAPLTYGQLDRQAKAIAAHLQQYQVQGERVLLLFPQGLEVIAAFCGCLYAGAIAIPIPPPESGRLKRTLPRLRAIVKDARARFALTSAGILSLIDNVEDECPEFEQIHWVDTEQLELNLAQKWQKPSIAPDDIAYLQYTSGSTSTPKGVMLSHFNLMHHANYLQTACGYTPESISVTWMPYFHDYGLVEGMILPLYNGSPCYLMSPFSFIKRPVQWLRNITRYQATHSQAPNFAYDLCIRRVKPKDIAELDLSSWEAAGNAAEPINPLVMEKFTEVFSECNFRWNTFAPAYGLAEYTLLVSTKKKGEEPVLCRLDASSLEKNLIVDAPADQQTGVRKIVSCGSLVCETQVAIVNPNTLTRCSSKQIGEIWVCDPSVTQGYWQRSQETQETFHAYTKDTGEGPFLRTGDLGFLKDGQLFITGRIKDLIIMRGTNHYPQDIEWTVQSLDPAFRSDYGACFAIENKGEEKLVIVQEINRRVENLDTKALTLKIIEAVAEEHEIQPSAIVLAKSGNILKTSSGKIQRRACRQNFLEGQLTFFDLWSDSPELVQNF